MLFVERHLDRSRALRLPKLRDSGGGFGAGFLPELWRSICRHCAFFLFFIAIASRRRTTLRTGDTLRTRRPSFPSSSYLVGAADLPALSHARACALGFSFLRRAALLLCGLGSEEVLAKVGCLSSGNLALRFSPLRPPRSGWCCGGVGLPLSSGVSTGGLPASC